MTMSNQQENEMQQPLTPIETSQQAFVELSDEELNQVAGGGFGFLTFLQGIGNTIGQELGTTRNTIGREFGTIGNTIGTIGNTIGATKNTIEQELGAAKNTV